MADSAGSPDRTPGVPALDRALTLLECLAQSRRGFSVSELSRRLGLPKSSVHLILRTLERRGYLQRQAAGGRYRFGLKLVALGQQALDGMDLRDEARPVLASLARSTGLTVHLGVLEQGEIVVIERIESSAPIRVVSWVGRRLPVHSTATGKALMAFLPEAERSEEMHGAPLSRPTDRTIATVPELERELARVRQLGYAVCDEEHEAGVRAVGAPILDAQGHAVAAVSVVGTVAQVPRERLQELGREVSASAAEIARRHHRVYALA